MKLGDVALIDTFWDWIDKSGGPESCWEWTRLRIAGGYGRLMVGKRGMKLAHRIAWELMHGPIPEGIDVLHRCDNPPCCNPSHLFLGTDAENAADREAKGRSCTPKLVGAECPWARLDEASVRDIRESCLPHREIAARFGIAVATVGAIKARRRWRHVV